MNISRFTTLLALLFFFYLFSSCQKPLIETKNDFEPKQLSNYGKSWQEIESMEKRGLSRDILQKLDSLLVRAEKEENPVQLFKIFAYQSKYFSRLEEDAIESIFKKYELKAKNSEFPLRQIMHSALAEMYYWYYQQNRWQFSNRTKTVEYNLESIQTWDLNTVIEKAIAHYDSSLSESGKLQKVPVSYAEEILVDPENRFSDYENDLRPTLYDLLAHRALDFYKTGEADVLSPANRYKIDPAYYTTYNEFLQLGLKVIKGFSTEYAALELYKDLLKYHKNASNKNALIYLDLQRLLYLRNNFEINNEDSIYISSLNQLKNSARNSSAVAEVNHSIAEFYFNQSEDESNEADYGVARVKAYQISKENINQFPKSYGASQSKALLKQLESKVLSFNSLTAEPIDDWSLINIHHKNIAHAYLKIVKSPFHPLEYENREVEEKVKLINELPAVFNDTISLGQEKDYLEHNSYYSLPPLPKGNYIVVLSNSPRFSYDSTLFSFEDIWISNLSYITRSQNSKLEIRALDRISGQSLRNVKVEAWKRVYIPSKREYTFNKKESKFTDHEGYVSFHSTENMENFVFLLTDGKDSLVTEEMFRVFHRDENSESRKSSHFFLDRSIYRPGQTVYFKNIIVEEKGKSKKVASGLKNLVKLWDVNGKEISTLSLTTNEYGSVSGFFVLPKGGLTGNYRIGNEYGSQFFSVEEYKRPTFQVILDSTSAAYKLNGIIPVSGTVKSYTGAAIVNAEIRYSIIRSVFYPYPYSLSSYWPQKNEELIASGVVEADSLGDFEFGFKAVMDDAINKVRKPLYNYSIQVTATSENGESQSNSMDVTVSEQTYILTSNIPEEVLLDSLNKIMIIAKNLAGKKVNPKLELTLQKLKEPKKIFLPKILNDADLHLMDSLDFITKFPHTAYSNEDKISSWSKDQTVLHTSISANKLIPFPELDAGAYFLKASTADEDGDSIVYEKYFKLYSSEKEILATPEAFVFFPMDEKVEVGETAEFILGSGFDEATMFWEIEVEGKIVEQKKIHLSSEQILIEIPVEYSYRGGFTAHVSFVKNNRSFSLSRSIDVPFTDKKLDIELSTFRSSLEPGSEEEWKIRVKNAKENDVKSELMLSMYDASLDQFKEHQWSFNIFKKHHSRLSWNVSNSFSLQYSLDFTKKRSEFFDAPQLTFPYLNWFGFHINYYLPPRIMKDGAQVELASNETAFQGGDKKELPEEEKASHPEPQNSQAELIPIRKNFRETAFFYPQLSANDSGYYTFRFKMPDVLTEWSFNAFTHTKDLSYGMLKEKITSKKELMVFPNMPRFFRQGDSLSISSRIMNMADYDLQGEVEIFFVDPITEKKLSLLLNDKSSKKFSINAHGSSNKEWTLSIPENIDAIKYQLVAKTKDFSDGEEKIIPVLSNKLLVTESLPMTIKGNRTEYFHFEKLKNSRNSKTLKNHRLTLEFTSNPTWYVVQALPYLMDNDLVNSEKIFSTFFANSLSHYIVEKNPLIKKVFERWKSHEPDALLSNLEKNEELKSILIEETPWLMDAKDESERKRRLAVLFDENRMQMEKSNALQRLYALQLSNGGWPWFASGPDDRYMTQYIVSGFGQLQKIGIAGTSDNTCEKMIEKAIGYIDARAMEDFKKIKGNDSNKHISYINIHYLYARSFFPEVKMDEEHKEAFDHFLGNLEEKWLEQSLYARAMAALIFSRNNEPQKAKSILESLRQNAIIDKEKGMYWKSNNNGYYWYQSAIETQALLMEAFKEIESDTESVEEMKVWLLKQKQTHNWGNSKATASACYSIISTAEELMLDKTGSIEIEAGNETIDLKENEKETASGYIKKTWENEEIKPQMANIKIQKESDGLAWGAMYWQYFENVDKISQSGNALNLQKDLFIEKIDGGNKILLPINEMNKIVIGDKVVVRIVLNVDQDMEYMHMKDLRASGLEPIETLSSYRSQDGLYYYQSIKDASTNFFFNYLSKGTYVFEYSLTASKAGKFSNGITTIQCMYAPEFTSHSKSKRIHVLDNN